MTGDLFDAIRKGDRDQVQQMLQDSPELVNSTHHEGITPILWAIYTGHADFVPLFPRELNLFEACATGRLDQVGKMLDANPALLRQYSEDGHTPLGLSIFFKHPELARDLVRRGADVN